MSARIVFRSFAAAITLSCLAVPGGAAPAVPPAPAKVDGNWTMPARDYASTRFSPLDQINGANVGALKVEFTFSTGVNRGQEAAPIVVGGTMYIVTPYSNILYALELSRPGAPQIRTTAPPMCSSAAPTADPPPAESLARRGIIDNVRGFMVYGDYADEAPQAPVIDAVARGDVDVALVWGPTAGYFAARSPLPLVLTPVTPWLDGPQSPMVYDISMGMRRGDRALRRELDRALERNRTAIATILDAYHVPRVAAGHASGPTVAEP